MLTLLGYCIVTTRPETGCVLYVMRNNIEIPLLLERPVSAYGAELLYLQILGNRKWLHMTIWANMTLAL